MRLRPDCFGCEIDSNEPEKHVEGCNYRAWPGLYDTIERQNRDIIELTKANGAQAHELAMLLVRDSDSERYRQVRHHDVFCLVLKELLTASIARGNTGGDNEGPVAVARRTADLAYPPPKGEP